MDFGLRGKTALVLAGGGGLGRAIAKSLAGEGANIAVAGRGADSIAGTQAALAEIGGKSMGMVWDLADLAQIDGNVAKIEKELGPVDILVNNTGGPPPTTASGQDAALWLKQFQAMVLSVIAITDRVLPNMRARHWGRIITSTSSGVLAPDPQPGDFECAASLAGRLVEDPGKRGRQRRHHGKCCGAGAHCDGSDQISRRGESQARRTQRGRSDGRECGQHPYWPLRQAGRIWRHGGVSCQ